MSSLLLRCLRREPSAGEIVPQIKSEARLQCRGLTTQCETEATLINDNPAAWSKLPPPNPLKERVFIFKKWNQKKFFHSMIFSLSRIVQICLIYLQLQEMFLYSKEKKASQSFRLPVRVFQSEDSVFWLCHNSNPSSVTGPPSEEAKESPPIRPIYVTSGPLPFSGSQTDVAWLLSSQRFLGKEKSKLTILEMHLWIIFFKYRMQLKSQLSHQQ